MLLELKISNFLSFQELTRFSMVEEDSITKNKNIIKISDISILKQAVIFGANASGKSNLISAFDFIKNYIVCPSIYIKDNSLTHLKPISLDISKDLNISSMFSKNSTGNEKLASSFEMTFSINNNLYYYSFEIIMKTQAIISESFYKLSSSDSETNMMIFERKANQSPIVNYDLFSSDVDKSRLRTYIHDFDEASSILFLTFMNSNKKYTSESMLYIFKEVFNWFNHHLVINNLSNILKTYKPYTISSLEEINRIISSFDTGITDIYLEKVSHEKFKAMLPKKMYKMLEDDINANISGLDFIIFNIQNEFYNIKINAHDDWDISTIKFKHGASPYSFELKEESSGTIRLFDLIDILLNKSHNQLYIIDELEKSLHPNITSKFIELFKVYQKNTKSQLIFTTHEASLLNTELLSRDEIWFVERDTNNNSHLFSLDTFEETYDHILDKAYLSGRYGAVPIINFINL